jgi:NAD(P)H-hydrate repair Nnr-like enzyme with NAD(P)H-hydrate dehydratase domain
MNGSREQRANSAAKMAYTTVVLKGAKTLIVAPNNLSLLTKVLLQIWPQQVQEMCWLG